MAGKPAEPMMSGQTAAAASASPAKSDDGKRDCVADKKDCVADKKDCVANKKDYVADNKGGGADNKGGGAKAAAAQKKHGERAKPVADLQPEWADRYLPLLLNDEELKAIMRSIYRDALGSFHDPKVFRFGAAIHEQLRKSDEPWRLHPMCVVAPTECSLHHYRSADPDSKDHALFCDAREDEDELRTVLAKATGMARVEWFCLMHGCYQLNAELLLALLRKAHPKQEFRVATDAEYRHVWVESRDRVFDLYWPAALPASSLLSPDRYANCMAF